MSKTTTVSKTRMLAEAAVMLALGIVLSLIKLLDLPYGGSITVACMLPVIIIAYRHGTAFGLLTGLVFGISQQLLGLNTLSYVTTWQSIVAVILLDYIVAFAVLGFGGIFRKMPSQATGLTMGALFVCLLRFLCHVISGCTVWAGLSIPTNAALIYSIGYNATYMVPETIVTAVIAYYVGSVIDFRNPSITSIRSEEQNRIPVLKLLAGAVLAIMLVCDVVLIFMHLQNAETGEFDASGLASVNWILVAIVSAASAVIASVLFVIGNKNSSAKA